MPARRFSHAQAMSPSIETLRAARATDREFTFKDILQ
jgi:hypothetical protein